MNEGKILVAEERGVYLLKLTGDVRMTLCASLNRYLDAIFRNPEVDDVIVDLLETEGVDSTTLGLLAKLAIYTEKHYKLKPTVFCKNQSISRILIGMGLDDIFDIVRETPEELTHLQELRPVAADEEQIKQHVLEAHKLLSVLNSKNQREFIDLIRSLESI